MDEVKVDIEEVGLAIFAADDVVVPDLFAECSRIVAHESEAIVPKTPYRQRSVSEKPLLQKNQPRMQKPAVGSG